MNKNPAPSKAARVLQPDRHPPFHLRAECLPPPPPPGAEIPAAMEALEKESCRVHEAIEVLEQRLCTVLRASAPAEAGLAGVLTNTQLGNGIASSTQRIAGASGRLADIIDRLEL